MFRRAFCTFQCPPMVKFKTIHAPLLLIPKIDRRLIYELFVEEVSTPV